MRPQLLLRRTTDGAAGSAAALIVRYLANPKGETRQRIQYHAEVPSLRAHLRAQLCLSHLRVDP
jgi:hypothetical protein